MCEIKLNLQLLHRVNPINNEICTSLFIGLARSESLNEVMFYICNMLNAHNPESSRYFDGLSISSG